MQFASLPQLSHEFAVLRPLREADLARWADYLDDPVVFQHTSWDHPGVDELRGYLGSECSGDPDARLRLAIAARTDDRLLGTIGFHSVSARNRVAEIAYDLHPEAWGRGLASSMVAEMVRWAHADAGVWRVQATVLRSNARSIRVLERAGFEREGLLRGYRWVRGEPGDFLMYAHFDRPGTAGSSTS